MYHIESGKPYYHALLKQFEEHVVILVQPAKPMCIGILVSAQNGGWTISCECELANGKPKHENPAEMDYPFIENHGQETSPSREWFQAAVNRFSLVTADGTVFIDPIESYVFSPPIFDAVCRWTEEFFERSEALFTPTWLIVDEMEAGLYRIWKLGELIIP